MNTIGILITIILGFQLVYANSSFTSTKLSVFQVGHQREHLEAMDEGGTTEVDLALYFLSYEFNQNRLGFRVHIGSGEHESRRIGETGHNVTTSNYNYLAAAVKIDLTYAGLEIGRWGGLSDESEPQEGSTTGMIWVGKRESFYASGEYRSSFDQFLRWAVGVGVSRRKPYRELWLGYGLSRTGGNTGFTVRASTPILGKVALRLHGYLLEEDQNGLTLGVGYIVN